MRTPTQRRMARDNFETIEDPDVSLCSECGAEIGQRGEEFGHLCRQCYCDIEADEAANIEAERLADRDAAERFDYDRGPRW